MIHWHADHDEKTLADAIKFLSCALLPDRPWMAEEGLDSVLDNRIFGETLRAICARITGNDTVAFRLIQAEFEYSYSAACERALDTCTAAGRHILSDRQAYVDYLERRIPDALIRGSLYMLLCANDVRSTDWDKPYIDKVCEACLLFHEIYALTRHSHEMEYNNMFLLSDCADAATINDAYTYALSLQYDVAREPSVGKTLKSVSLQYLTGYVSSHADMSRYGMRRAIVQAAANTTQNTSSFGHVSQYRTSDHDNALSVPELVRADKCHADQSVDTVLIEDADLRVDDRR
ncbi:hypothetical protein JMUB6875_51650 [Nocardia sp. JMUB6875]